MFLLAGIPLGNIISRVLTGEKTFMTPLLRPVKSYCRTRIASVDEEAEMSWKKYAYALIIFNIIGIAFLFILQLIQNFLPLNPAHMSGVRWDTALNTAISFTTNTNWQSYAGESTMSYITQMLGLTLQNFLSASVGIAALLVLIRGFTRQNSNTIGNFWVDITRTTLYILLPLATIFAIILASQGVVATVGPYVSAHTISGVKRK